MTKKIKKNLNIGPQMFWTSSFGTLKNTKALDSVRIRFFHQVYKIRLETEPELIQHLTVSFIFDVDPYVDPYFSVFSNDLYYLS